MKIAITFDCERDWYPDNYSYGRYTYSSNPEFGMLERSIPRFLEFGEKYNTFFTFFLTGEVAQHTNLFCATSNNDIGIHTHPYTHLNLFKHPPEEFRQRDDLSRYSLEEQCAMIKEDKKLIQEFTSIEPISFRAGSLCYNNTTRKALAMLGIKANSSLRCNFSLFGWKPFYCEGILEIPIYGYLPADATNPVRKFTLSKKVNFLNTYLVVNLHPMNFGVPGLKNRENRFARFERFLAYLKKSNFKFCTIRQIFEENEDINNSNPTINRIGNLFRIFSVLLGREIFPIVGK